MSESILVENLSKEYEIGRAPQETMLRERLVNVLRHPIASIHPRKQTIWALRGVSFRIEEGEVVGIIGRNGAGKSTLLKILSKITYPTTGSVRTRGRLASLLEVGTGFHDELTGRENIYLNGSILGMKKKEVDARLDAIISFSGVEPFIDTPIKHYSSGMRLRLGFAVAAHLDPDVLIVDEVLAVGDAGFRKKCLNTMEDLRKSGRTVLFVSHSMGAVEGLCSRVIWINDGQLRMDGSPGDVIRSYMTTFSDQQQIAHDLRHIERRLGTGEIRFTAVEFLSAARDPQPVTRTGDRVVIRFRYHAVKTVSHPSIGFRVYTEFGAMVTSTSTWLHGIEIPFIPPGDGYIDVDIASLNLVPARYMLSLWFSDGSYDSLVYDRLDPCVRLDVEASNSHGSGRSIDSGYGIVYFPQTWDLHGIERDPAPVSGF
jgi:lipopolysaccharide transport system ATP-binding protein